MSGEMVNLWIVVEAVSQRANVMEEGSSNQVPWCSTAGRGLVSRGICLKGKARSLLWNSYLRLIILVGNE